MTAASSATPIAAALEGFLAANEPQRTPIVRSCEPVTGGYSRRTYFADVSWSDGVAERLVLRADPPEGTGVFESDREVECAVLQWLSRSAKVAVAHPRYYDGAGEVHGTKCLVTDFVSGPTLQSVAAKPGLRERAADLFVRTIAGIHRIPIEDRPIALVAPTDSDSYLDEIADLYLRAERESCDSSPVLRYAAAVLRSHRPPPVPLGLVHGDCQPGNILLRCDGQPVVIDWEFAHIGDPREDLGYYRQIPMQPNLYTSDPQGFLERYRELAGWTAEQLNPLVVDYFLLVGMARLLCQLLRACDRVGRGSPRAALAAYLVGAVSLQYDLFFDICRRIERSGWTA